MNFFSSVQLLSHVQLLSTPWIAARQTSLSITNSWSLLKLMYIELVMHPTISSSVVPFSSCLQSFPASGSFPMSHFLTSGGQSIGVSASSFDSILPIKIKPLIQEQGEGNGDPLQYSCLENSMDGGAW